MPHLIDADCPTHLRRVIRARTHWVFVTDCTAGVLRLLAVALRCTNAGMPQGELDYGTFDWIEGRTGRGSTVQFLTVPKDARPDVRRILGRDWPGPPEGTGQDLIQISTEPERLSGLLAAISDGKVWPVGNSEAN